MTARRYGAVSSTVRCVNHVRLTFAAASQIGLAVPSPDTAGYTQIAVALIGLVAALVGARWISSVIETRANLKKRRDETTSTDIRRAQEDLKNLRRAYRLRSRRHAQAPSDNELSDLVDELDTSAARALCDTVVERAREYVEIGGLYAAGDPDTGEAAEAKAFRLLSDALREELKRNR